MGNALKNSIPTGIALLFGVLLIVALFALTPRADAQPSQISQQATATASTSLAFMTSGSATSTYQIDSASVFSSTKPNINMAAIDRESVYILFNASSSASILVYQFQFSNNNIDWYAEGGPLATGATGIATSTALVHTYSSGASGVSNIVVLAPDLPGYHERIVFSIPNGSANGGVYAEIDTKKNPSNP